MTEGWHDDEYLVLFDEDEVEVMTERYGLNRFINGLSLHQRFIASSTVYRFINGFRVSGLRGWDDFILQDDEGKLFTVPTVPVAQEYLKPFS